MALLDDVRTLAEIFFHAIGEVGTPDGGVLQRSIPHYVRERKDPPGGGSKEEGEATSEATAWRDDGTADGNQVQIVKDGGFGQLGFGKVWGCLCRLKCRGRRGSHRAILGGGGAA